VSVAQAWDADAADERAAQPIIDPEGLRFSRLKLMAESPLHYLANVQGESKALDKGTAVHSILLGGKRVCYYVRPPSEYELALESGREIVVYEKQRRGKEWEAFAADHPEALILSPSEHDKAKAAAESDRAPVRSGEAWRKFEADNADALILSKAEYESTNRCADAVRRHPKAMQVLSGITEETIRFNYLNIPSRTTPDVRANDGSFFTELKTCRSSRPGRFAAQARWMHYHVQMAWHREGMRRARLWGSKDAKPTPYIVAAQSTAPYPVTVFKVTETAMDMGERAYRFWVEQLKSCMESNQWPAYAQGIIDLDIAEEGLVEGVANNNAEIEGW
jgi:hypothetical protein